MFTGIVTHQGRLLDVRGSDADALRTLVIHVAPAIDGAVVGSSIAVQGTCLTATAIESADDGAQYHFDVVPETLRKTTLGRLAVGDTVNIEGSLRVGDEIGGHWVQGHVDGVGTIVEVDEGGAEGDDWCVTVSVPETMAPDLLPKGSITIDGVSLTVGEVFQGPDGGTRFNVYLIPHTLAVTTLGRAAVGAGVNLERDIMARWVGHHVERYLAARG
ncbi:MAG: riboflavin synthase [Planctomycetota bacterium]|nr:riboflavin synthase [Planctomycetota bacterium]